MLDPGVVISDPLNLEFVLRNENVNVITKGEIFKKRSWDLFGEGIINSDGGLWRDQRRAGMKFFSGSNLGGMVERVLPEAWEGCVTRLKEAANGSGVEQLVDMQAFFLDLTTAVVGRMAYDMQIDGSSEFSQAFDYASDRTGLRFQNPLYWLTEWILPSGWRFRNAVKIVEAFGQEIVVDAKTKQAAPRYEKDGQNQTLISSLLSAFPLSDSLVADSALNFLSAGRDSTAQSMSWAWHVLNQSPAHLARIRTEVATNIPNYPSTDLAISDLAPQNLSFTFSCFLESLRLYPPVPIEVKQCQQDVTLPDGTFLPKNSVIVWSIWAMNRASEIWHTHPVLVLDPEICVLTSFTRRGGSTRIPRSR